MKHRQLRYLLRLIDTPTILAIYGQVYWAWKCEEKSELELRYVNILETLEEELKESYGLDAGAKLILAITNELEGNVRN